MSRNENCLKGWQCPQCGQEDHFKVEAVRRLEIELFDDGTDDKGADTEYGAESPARCPECNFSGLVFDMTCRDEGRRMVFYDKLQRLAQAQKQLRQKEAELFHGPGDVTAAAIGHLYLAVIRKQRQLDQFRG